MFRSRACAALTLAALTTAASAQLLNPSFDEPGFQTTFMDWEQFGGNIYIIEDPGYQPALDGTGCGKIFGNFDGQQQSDSGVYQRVAAAAGEEWTASINVLHRNDDAMAGANLALLLISWRDVNGAEISADAEVILDANSPLDQWLEAEVTGVAPVGTVAADFFLLFLQFADDDFPFGAPGAMFFDLAGFELTGSGCDADLNGDGVVNTQDFIRFLGLWSSGDPQADWNNDGNVNTQDFVAFLNEWAAGC